MLDGGCPFSLSIGSWTVLTFVWAGSGSPPGAPAVILLVFSLTILFSIPFPQELPDFTVLG